MKFIVGVILGLGGPITIYYVLEAVIFLESYHFFYCTDVDVDQVLKRFCFITVFNNTIKNYQTLNDFLIPLKIYRIMGRLLFFFKEKLFLGDLV